MFWENFVKLCEARGVKPNPVAKELGLSSGSVTYWKQGKIPQSTTLQKLADYFGVTTDTLLNDAEAEYKGCKTNLNFWESIKNLCDKHSTTPTAVLKALGLSTSMVTRWKTGTIPNKRTLEKLANYFGVTTDALLGYLDIDEVSKMVKKIFEELCKERGVSPTSACSKIGISSSAYSQWTDTTIPRNSTLKRMSEYFGVTPAYLMEENQVDIQAEKDNYDIPGHAIINGIERKLSEQEIELLNIFRKLDIVKQAKLLVMASEFENDM